MRSRLLWITLGVVCVYAMLATSTNAGGISVDAGLTPGEDRWILRTQLRYMQRKDDPTQMGREMSSYAFPIVLAYGFRPHLTLMIRQVVMHREMSMTATTERSTGHGDPFILAKYKGYRRNTSKYTVGIAPTLGLEFPLGNASFTSETWDLNTGLYISARAGPWATDFNIAYAWNGFADQGRDGIDPGDELSLDAAFAHQFSIGEKARASLAPVLELSYRNVWPDRLNQQDIANTGESVVYLSPGIKRSTSWLILEALVQIPIWQDQKGSQLKQDMGVLLGARSMF